MGTKEDGKDKLRWACSKLIKFCEEESYGKVEVHFEKGVVVSVYEKERKVFPE